MATVPRLTYFDIKGRALPIRMAYHYAKVEFEDVRVGFADWATVKPTTRFGMLPELELPSGDVIAQSHAILRYVGRQNGLYPEDALAAAKVDAAMGFHDDVTMKIMPTLFMADKDLEAKLRKELADDVLPPMLAKLDALFDKDYLLGDTLTIADLMAFHMYDWLTDGSLAGIPALIMEPCTNLKRVHDKIQALPEFAGFNFA